MPASSTSAKPPATIAAAGSDAVMLTATVEYRVHDGVAVITVQNPPVNALSHSVRIGLIDGLARADADAGIKALVLMGGGRTYMAGADLKEFGKPKDPPELHEVQAAMEALSKPIVSAIHGTALGGGLEVALTGHWRVAMRDAKLGLPEIKLGLMPGAGGNQRLTRLIGPQAALELILSGRSITAAEAQQLGIVDEIVGSDLLAGALDFARRVVAEKRSLRVVRHLKDKTSHIDPQLFTAARQRIAREMPGLLAPQKIVDCVEAACVRPTDEAFRFDAESYKQCLDSPQRKAMIHLFFAERASRKVPDLPQGIKPTDIHKAAVIGAGNIGAGIARQLAAAGLAVRLIDSSSEAVAAALAGIRGSKDAERIEGYTNFDAAADADIVIEGMFENLSLKQDVLSRIEHVVSPDCILATDTSFLDVDEIASALSRPAQLISAHFYDAADTGQLIELVRGSHTAPQAIVNLFELGRMLDRTVILSGRSDGAIGRRMLQYLIAGAEYLLEQGCTPEQIDGTVERFGLPCGPLALCDRSGLDVVLHMRRMRAETRILRPAHNGIVEALVEHGLQGCSSGAGYYLYRDGARLPNPQAKDIIAGLSGKAQPAWDDEKILACLLHPLVNEGAKLLEQGTALRASDIDLVWARGFGFPQYLGGPMFWGSQIGLDRIATTLATLSAELGQDWQAAPLLLRLIVEGKNFTN